MGLSEYFEAVKIAKERKLAKKKETAIKNTSDIMGIYAENAVRKFKMEYIVQSNSGKRFCSIPIDPYPDEVVMKKIWAFGKKEYLVEFEKVLAQKLAEQGFVDYSLSDNFLNSKCPIILKVKW